MRRAASAIASLGSIVFVSSKLFLSRDITCHVVPCAVRCGSIRLLAALSAVQCKGNECGHPAGVPVVPVYRCIIASFSALKIFLGRGKLSLRHAAVRATRIRAYGDARPIPGFKVTSRPACSRIITVHFGALILHFRSGRATFFYSMLFYYPPADW